MYSLRLTCSAEEVDRLSGELWEAGTVGIHELPCADRVQLMAAFEREPPEQELAWRFLPYSPQWKRETSVDWVRYTQEAWSARSIGERLFLAPPWSNEVTPHGRERIIHNPGLACGTGEHPCTRLALRVLEKCVGPTSRVIDIGTGSGILAIAALRLGAKAAIGVDVDETALQVARENFLLNDLPPLLIAGSADAISHRSADITAANLNCTVLLPLLDELQRITRVNGRLILTGFTEHELPAFEARIPRATVSEMNQWRCISATLF